MSGGLLGWMYSEASVGDLEAMEVGDLEGAELGGDLDNLGLPGFMERGEEKGL